MKTRLIALILGALLFPVIGSSTVINFSGPLRVIELDTGGIYSGTALNTIFTGSIDDETFFGDISDGVTETDFFCCIAAGGLEITNDVVIDMDTADLLNEIAETDEFSASEVVDIVDIEGDDFTLQDGRIEVGLSYVLNSAAFPDENPSNYPFDPGDVRLAIYFILEENFSGEDIYSALGRVNVIPVPAAVWLFGSALGLLGWMRRRRLT